MEREGEELKQLIRRNIELTKETRDIVDRMHRSARRGSLLRWGWRAFIFGAALLGYYYFIWPYVQQIQVLYGSVQSGVVDVQEFSEQFFNMLKNFGR